MREDAGRFVSRSFEQSGAKYTLTLVCQGPAKPGSCLILILASNGTSAKGLLFQSPGRSRIHVWLANLTLRRGTLLRAFYGRLCQQTPGACLADWSFGSSLFVFPVKVEHVISSLPGVDLQLSRA